jgi:hypothetical protein
MVRENSLPRLVNVWPLREERVRVRMRGTRALGR